MKKSITDWRISTAGSTEPSPPPALKEVYEIARDALKSPSETATGSIAVIRQRMPQMPMMNGNGIVIARQYRHLARVNIRSDNGYSPRRRRGEMMASNIEKMREALDETRKFLLDIQRMLNCEPTHPAIDRLKSDAILSMANTDIPNKVMKITETIALPLRNCDVGTAEEQYKRHLKFCKHNRKCLTNDGFSIPCARCFAKWAQEPHKEREEK